jgi:hypothetical protein
MTTLDDPYLCALCAELESICDPFAQKLEEVIDRSERDGICSEKAAEAAREKIGRCMEEVNLVLLKTFFCETIAATLGVAAPEAGAVN